MQSNQADSKKVKVCVCVCLSAFKEGERSEVKQSTPHSLACFFFFFFFFFCSHLVGFLCSAVFGSLLFRVFFGGLVHDSHKKW